MPWRALTDLWLLGRRTSSLDCPRILEEETVGTWECGGGRRGWKVCGADSAHQQSQILHIHPWRMGTLEQSPWKVKLWENFRGKIWEDEKKPRWRVHSFVRSFIRSLTNYCVLTASYMPAPVLDAEDSALCTIRSAVVFMEPSGEETADKQETKR